MTGKTHMATGALFAIGCANLTGQTDPITFVAGMGVSVFASLLPDIDHTESKISRNPLFMLPSHIVCTFTTHRGIIHSLIGLVAMSGIWFLIISLLSPALSIINLMDTLPYFIAGYFSHLFADTCNKGGVGWLQPFIKKKFSILPIKTNTPTELLFSMPVIALTIIFGIESFSTIL